MGRADQLGSDEEMQIKKIEVKQRSCDEETDRFWLKVNHQDKEQRERLKRSDRSSANLE